MSVMNNAYPPPLINSRFDRDAVRKFLDEQIEDLARHDTQLFCERRKKQFAERLDCLRTMRLVFCGKSVSDIVNEFGRVSA